MQEPEPTRNGPIAALIVILMLVVGGLWLQHHIHANSLIEDCMLSGRKNCVPIVP